QRNLAPSAAEWQGNLATALAIALIARDIPSIIDNIAYVGGDLASARGDRFHSARSPRRRIWVICATIEIATSAGDTPPIPKPIGPWMRARSFSPKPSSVSRLQRAACVRRDPSAPM